MAGYQGIRVKDHLGVFPILRAGLGMVEAVMELLPTARIHHLGLYREKVYNHALIPLLFIARAHYSR